jgi:hypothetical protein
MRPFHATCCSLWTSKHRTAPSSTIQPDEVVGWLDFLLWQIAGPTGSAAGPATTTQSPRARPHRAAAAAGRDASLLAAALHEFENSKPRVPSRVLLSSSLFLSTWVVIVYISNFIRSHAITFDLCSLSVFFWSLFVSHG